ncbi:MAG TPA: SPOR domain-containing protein [Steroidobacteraceae bacterium]|nr:SPOR domain-containing protein [Steroidobacteraceae bacterium]
MDEQLKARLIGAVVLVAFAVLLIPELLSGRKAENHAVEGAATRGLRTYQIDLGGGALPPTAPTPAPAPKPAASPAPVPTSGAAPLPMSPGAATPTPGAPSSSAANPPVAPPVPATPPASTSERSKPPAAAVASAPVGSPKPLAAASETASPPKPAGPAATGAAPAPAATAPASPPKPTTAAKGGWAVQVGAFSTAAAANKLINDLKGAGYMAYPAPLAKGGKTLHRVRVGPVGSKSEAEQLAGRLKARKLPATVVTND